MQKFILPFFIVFTLSGSLIAQNSIYKSADRAYQSNCMAPFYHGVASGDPLQDRVILWTRLTPDTISTDSVLVNWRIATDTSMVDIINSGSKYTSQNIDYTVKVDATGLQPGKFYYYDFNYFGRNSIRGRTKTAPSGDNDSARFAVMSCARYEEGYFNAYKKVADRNDVDAVIFLGDFIYEEVYATFAPDRDSAQTEPLTLPEYRHKYSMNKLDADLIRVQQQYPWICIWDDHETADDSYTDGADNHDPNTEGNWYLRKAYANKAYEEWMPIRMPSSDPSIIYRKIQYGDLINFYMLDTRLEGRSKQVNTANIFSLGDANRTIISPVQYNWLLNNMKNSTARWNVIGQQVMIAPLKIAGIAVNKDQWDDYPVQRQKLLDDILNNNIKNVVVLTGDIHTSWANDLPANNYNGTTGVGSAGVEFVTPSVTSKGFPLGAAGSAIQAVNTHIKYAEVTSHGYYILDINKQRTQADWYYVQSIIDHSNVETYAASYYVNDNERFLRVGSSPSIKMRGYGYVAPSCPLVSATGISNQSAENYILMGSYPNPFSDKLLVQVYNKNIGNLTISLIDVSGKNVLEKKFNILYSGLWEFEMETTALAKGVYSLIVSSGSEIKTRKIIKL